MTRRRGLALLVALLAVAAAFAVRDSVHTVGRGVCGTPWRYDDCLKPVVFFAGWGVAIALVLAVAVFVLLARRRPPVLLLVGAVAVGLILGSPVAARSKPDGCNDWYGYTARGLSPVNGALMRAGAGTMRGGYQTLMNCFTSADG